jgi:adenosine deaminase
MFLYALTRNISHSYQYVDIFRLSLLQHPRLISLVKERNICIESCPISNVALGFVRSMPHHPILAMIAHGIPVVIGNDDPAIFGSTKLGRMNSSLSLADRCGQNQADFLTDFLIRGQALQVNFGRS